MMPFSAVLFDLDGTLLDTAPDLITTVNEILRREGLAPVAPETLKNEASNGGTHLLRCALGEARLEALGCERLRQDFMDIYAANICQNTQFFSGVDALLNCLNKAKIPWGIVTNKPEYLARHLIAHWPVFEHCQILIGGDTLMWSKPHPAPLLYACKSLGHTPASMLYVGDHLRDIQAGRYAAMKTAIAGWGYIDAQEDTNSWYADFYVSAPDHLQQLILN